MLQTCEINTVKAVITRKDYFSDSNLLKSKHNDQAQKIYNVASQGVIKEVLESLSEDNATTAKAEGLLKESSMFFNNRIEGISSLDKDKDPGDNNTPPSFAG